MGLNILGHDLAQVVIPTSRDSIYKDECVMSFDTPESSSGLYISLTSFLGFGEDYYKLYHRKTGHSLFLHHKRTKTIIPVEPDEEGPEKKITRMAIGVEGGFSADSGPKYDYSDAYSIVVLPEGLSVPLSDVTLPAKVRESADAVIAASSSFRKAELDALQSTWDGELRLISKHADNLVQLDNGKKIPSFGWKCEQCEMDNNLWLNLTDGTILCGRKNFDGSGGNNHGVEHFQVTRYPLAVKLGTISQDGTADVFSYDEDDLVVDPNLAKHLAHFGIHINQLQKTDKSMAELEIELNKKVGEWVTCQESGSALVPVYGPGRTGLVNLGSSCYMNSVMQVVFSIPPFVRRYVDEYPDMVEKCDFRDPANDFQLQMGKLGFGLCSGKYALPPPDGCVQEQEGISPRMFRQVVAHGVRQWQSNQQQDAEEFFIHLTNVMHELRGNRPSVADVFKFQKQDRYQCTETMMVKYENQTAYCLSLPVPLEAATNKQEVLEYERKKQEDAKTELVRSHLHLQSCIDALTRTEELEGFKSTSLNKRTTAMKTTRFSTFPDYLMVHLAKFTLRDGQTVKLDVAVDVPDELGLEPFRGHGLQPGEVAQPEDDCPDEINLALVTELGNFGLPLEAAKRAVYFTKATTVEQAYQWYENHISDPDLLSEFVPPGTRRAKKKAGVNEELVSQIMAMDFSRPQAFKALRMSNNNVEAAIDWIFSNPDDAGDLDPPPGEEQPETPCTDGPAKYKLCGFITHMGTSASVGHYVCHILLDGQWVIFNDNKVALSVNPPKELAYLYLYQRIGTR